jgi:hypothetical protein
LLIHESKTAWVNTTTHLLSIAVRVSQIDTADMWKSLMLSESRSEVEQPVAYVITYRHPVTPAMLCGSR